MAKYVPTKRGSYSTRPDGGLTHAEIGEALGVSPQRVQQIEAAAFRKIREQFPEMELFIDTNGRVNPVIYFE